MTTHTGHDHPNTKAGRAKCRREGGPLSATADAVRDRPIPDPKPRKRSTRQVTEPIHTSLPHQYDEDIERPDRCYVCKLTKRARVHD